MGSKRRLVLERRIKSSMELPALAMRDGKDELDGASGDGDGDGEEGGVIPAGKDTRIRSGEDVSNYAISIHDTLTPSLTFRSLVLGTVVAGLGAALSQIYLFKPIDVPVSSVFLLLLILGLGKVWEKVVRVPRGWDDEEVRGLGVKRGVARIVRWMNPGPFGLKEHVVATLVATTAGTGSTAVNNFAVQRLFYDTKVSATTAVLATFSTATFGYGLVGLLRPLTVYPSEMVYWTMLPNVLTFQALHFDKTRTSKRLKLFWGVLGGTAIYELFPQYIFPLLNGFSIPCLATQRAPQNVQFTITNIFGGASGNEGLGLFELGFDWQYITSSYLVYPLVQQVNSWIGFVICYAAVVGVYYSNTWDAKNYPFLSTSIFSNTSTAGNPVRYNQTAVFGTTFRLNETALEQEGIPQYAGAYVWTLMASNWAVGGLFAHCILFWGRHVVDSIKLYSKYQAAHRDRRRGSGADSEAHDDGDHETHSGEVRMKMDGDEKEREGGMSFGEPLSPSGPEAERERSLVDGVGGSEISPFSSGPPPIAYNYTSTPGTKNGRTPHRSPAHTPAPAPAHAHAGMAGDANPTQTLDRHYLAMMKYPEAPWWWYALLLLLSFIAGLVVVIVGDTTLPVWGYVVALIIGSVITPFSNLLSARLGNGISTNLLVKMIAGALHPGEPVANLYFSMWSHDVVNTAIHLAGDLKVGQYLKIPPRVMFLTQVWGTILGCIVNYAVMVSIVTSKRDILLDPQGTNIWSGQTVQAFNSQAVTWSLASQVFGIHSRYIWVPVGLLLGAIPTCIQWLIWKRWPKIGPVPVDMIVLPVIYQYAQWLTTGVNSVILTTITAGIVSQVWLRRSHPRWFRKYIYILGGAIDGGTQILVFILSFAVFGASGVSRPFPTWWGNPSLADRNIDYCALTN